MLDDRKEKKVNQRVESLRTQEIRRGVMKAGGKNDLVPHDCDVPEGAPWTEGKEKWGTLYLTGGCVGCYIK